MPIDVTVKEQRVVLGNNDSFLAELDVLDETGSDSFGNYIDSQHGSVVINNISFNHNLMEISHRTSNATLSRPTRGIAEGSYAFRSRYAENMFTVTLPLLNNSEKYVSNANDLIDDLRTFGFIHILSNYLPRIEECQDIYSVDEFRITIDSELDIHILEIDIQPVNMAIFGSPPENFLFTSKENLVGDLHSVTALDEIVHIGSRPTLEQRRQKMAEGGHDLGEVVGTSGLGKSMTEFRAFLEDSRAHRVGKEYNKTNYHEDDIVGDFDLTFRIPYIYEKDGPLSDSGISIKDENSDLEIMDTSEEALIREGADYRIFKMVDLRSPPITINTEDGPVDYDGKSVFSYYEGNEVSYTAKVAKDYIVRYVPDNLSFDNAVHNIKTITYTKSYKFARHYIGNSNIPLTQYIGPKPATLSIVSHYAAPDMNNEYNVTEDVPHFFQRMVRHIDDNNKIYPMANAFNFIKIEDAGLNYISGKYVPSDTYRIATADNSNIEVYATNFIESDMDTIYKTNRFKLANEPISSSYSRVAADLVAKYLVVAKAYFAKKDFSDQKAYEFHTTLLQRMVRLKRRIEGEANGNLVTLDGFERTEYIDPETKIKQNSGEGSVETPKETTETQVGGKLVIMGDSIAVGFWNSLSDSQRQSDKVIMTARSSWGVNHIFVSGSKETSKQGGAKTTSKIQRHSAEGTKLPSQLSMLSGVDLKDCTVILSSGISNEPLIKDQTLADHINNLAKQVKSIHILGVASNYQIKAYDGRNNKLADRLKGIAKGNISLGPSSAASDKIHPNPNTHTEAHRIAKEILG